MFMVTLFPLNACITLVQFSDTCAHSWMFHVEFVIVGWFWYNCICSAQSSHSSHTKMPIQFSFRFFKLIRLYMFTFMKGIHRLPLFVELLGWKSYSRNTLVSKVSIYVLYINCLLFCRYAVVRAASYTRLNILLLLILDKQHSKAWYLHIPNYC